MVSTKSTNRPGTSGKGYIGDTWSSISGTDTFSYEFELNAELTKVLYGISTSYAIPLRCLVNSTVGEIGNR